VCLHLYCTTAKYDVTYTTKIKTIYLCHRVKIFCSVDLPFMFHSFDGRWAAVSFRFEVTTASITLTLTTACTSCIWSAATADILRYISRLYTKLNQMWL